MKSFIMNTKLRIQDEDTNTPEYVSWRHLHLTKSKLSNVSEMASLMAGFAVVATVELQINKDETDPKLLTAFAVATTMIAIMIARRVLPQIQMEMIYQVYPSPHEQMGRLIDVSWKLANTASLFLFTVDTILICWIKFTNLSKTASVAATVILTPVLLLILIFDVVFYRKVIDHQFVHSNLKYLELERMKQEIEREMAFTSTYTNTSSFNDTVILKNSVVKNSSAIFHL